jgi:hypothetical protein
MDPYAIALSTFVGFGLPLLRVPGPDATAAVA